MYVVWLHFGVVDSKTLARRPANCYNSAMPSREKLAEFTAWCGKNITGDEKGQAQIFLDRLFQAFGQSGSLDVGGHPEFRIRKSNEAGGITAFADYGWKPVVFIEAKNERTSVEFERDVDNSQPFPNL